MKRLGVGLIGSGFMGKAHALAFRQVAAVFSLPVQIDLEMLADIDDDTAKKAADAFGFKRSCGDWKKLVSDDQVDIVAITAPNKLHKDIALAAMENNKIVYCEKPLAATLADAQVMTDAANQSNTITLVGFNYLQNPIIK